MAFQGEELLQMTVGGHVFRVKAGEGVLEEHFFEIRILERLTRCPRRPHRQKMCRPQGWILGFCYVALKLALYYF